MIYSYMIPRGTIHGTVHGDSTCTFFMYVHVIFYSYLLVSAHRVCSQRGTC